MNRSLRSCSLFVFSSVIAACSSSGSEAQSVDAAADTASTSEAAPTDAPSNDAPGADTLGACNAIENVAQAIPIVRVASNPPAATGGNIANGTYVMTDATIYTGPGGSTGSSGTTRTTISVTGGVVQSVSDGDPGRQTDTVTFVGTTYTATDTCPDDTTRTGTFSATDTTFAVQIPSTDGTSTFVETFTLK